MTAIKDETERELIEGMQVDVALVKETLARIVARSSRVVTINHDAERFVQSADAMIWRGAVKCIGGDLDAAHGVVSKALLSGYDNGAEIIAYGPGGGR